MWGEIDSTKIETDWSGIDELERERIQRSQAELEAREKRKREERATSHRSARGSSGRWPKAPPEGVETYLERKGVTHEKGIKLPA
jgi:hypothetical protein